MSESDDHAEVSWWDAGLDAGLDEDDMELSDERSTEELGSCLSWSAVGVDGGCAAELRLRRLKRRVKTLSEAAGVERGWGLLVVGGGVETRGLFLEEFEPEDISGSIGSS